MSTTETENERTARLRATAERAGRASGEARRSTADGMAGPSGVLAVLRRVCRGLFTGRLPADRAELLLRAAGMALDAQRLAADHRLAEMEALVAEQRAVIASRGQA